MGFTAKLKGRTSNTMGFLLVFFPEEHGNSTGNGAVSVDKQKLLSSPSSSSSSSPLSSSSFRRSISNNPILTKAQSTISICAFLLFITLILFTLSTFEPSIPAVKSQPFISSRRFLHQALQENRTNSRFKSSFFLPKSWVGANAGNEIKFTALLSIALQRMGVLYRRGTRAMNDLIVAHVVENVTENEFRLFLRLLHRSGLLGKSDIVFIFDSPARFVSVIEEENESFLKLLDYYKAANSTALAESPASFDITQFVNSGKKDKRWAEPIWGKRIGSNSSGKEEAHTGSTRTSYGSIVGFDAAELDPENSLAGFLDHVPMTLRRWACYPMLLGRVRRKFKHIILVDAKNILLLGDPLARSRNRSPETVLVLNTAEKPPTKHGRRNSERTQPQHRRGVNPEIIMGGERGIRRFSNTMLTEIVRAAMERKKSSVSESTVLSQLAGNGYLLKDSVSLITLTESVPDSSSLTGSNSKGPGSRLFLSGYSMIRRSNKDNHDISSVVAKEICSCEVDSSVYNDC